MLHWMGQMLKAWTLKYIYQPRDEGMESRAYPQQKKSPGFWSLYSTHIQILLVNFTIVKWATAVIFERPQHELHKLFPCPLVTVLAEDDKLRLEEWMLSRHWKAITLNIALQEASLQEKKFKQYSHFKDKNSAFADTFVWCKMNKMPFLLIFY